MLFNSYPFWAFFLIVYIVYWKLPKNYQNIYLLIASYIFYGSWDWRFLSLIMISTMVDFWAGISIVKNDIKRNVYLSISIITNLGILGIFKYFGFFSDQLSHFFTLMGVDYLFPTMNIILPIGISFYTFQTMSYTIDIYRGNMEPIDNLIDFALYVSFFPQLVAGPIERSYRLLPQIIQPRQFCKANISEGLYYIIYGLFLKIVIADNMAIISDSIFNQDPEDLVGVDVLFGSYAFAFQIYGDFSGYSFIAKGLAKCLGIDLMTNFKMPYLSIDPSDFWRRWHISLSSWLRDYLYIPLGGNKQGKLKTYRNLFITMLLGGLWHGANWTFIFWGMFHGIILIIYRVASELKIKALFELFSKMEFFRSIHLLRCVIMFHLVCIGWIFFRSETISHAYDLLEILVTHFQQSSLSLTLIGLIAFYIIPIFIYELWNEKKGYLNFQQHSTSSLILFFNYCLFMIIIFPAPSHKEFIYFQF